VDFQEILEGYAIRIGQSVNIGDGPPNLSHLEVLCDCIFAFIGRVEITKNIKEILVPLCRACRAVLENED